MTSLLERFHIAARDDDCRDDDSRGDDWFGAEAHVVTGEPLRSAAKPPPIVDDLDDPEWLPL